MSSTSQLTNFSIADLAWAAGIVDGEGCISLIRMKRYDNYGTGINFDLRLEVGNTDLRMLLKLRDLFGGSISGSQESRSNRKPCGTWHLHGAKAAMVLIAIRPYLCVKGEQADVAILSRDYLRHDKKPNMEKAKKMLECSERLAWLKKNPPFVHQGASSVKH